MRTRSITIFASEVPVISGNNPFRSIEDTFFQVWKRTNPKQIVDITARLDLATWQTTEERVKSEIKDFGLTIPVKELLKESLEAKTIERVAQVAAKIPSIIVDCVPKAKQQEIQRHVTSEMHKSFGMQHESIALKHFEQTRGVIVKERNLRFFKRKLGTVEDIGVYVGGRIDGRTGGKVVEVKNRLKRFLSPIPMYDIIQLQTYLYILQAKEGELVEYVKRDKGNSRQTAVQWDEVLWKYSVEPYLLHFSRALALFMNNENCQIQFLRSKDPLEQRDLIKSFWCEGLQEEEM